MTILEHDAIEAELRRAIDAAERAANCARTSLLNLGGPVQYTLTDAHQSMKSAADAQANASRARNLLLTIRDREES